MNLAYAFVVPEFANIGMVVELDLCGTSVAAQVIAPGPYNPDYSLMRG
jgi:dimethylglycine dehydrogenase